MKEVINLFYEDYLKALKTTKDHCLRLKSSINEINKKINNKDDHFNYELYLELELFGLKGLQHKLVASTYILADSYIKISSVYDTLDENQQKNINEYKKVLKLVKETNEKVTHFIEDHTSTKNNNL